MKGITQRDFQSWRHNPVSAVFLQYLKDYRARVLDEIQREWQAGPLAPEREHEARWRIKVTEEIATLQFDHIAAFYEIGEDRQQTETENE